MRKRNIKLNIYLNEEEKNMLEEKSNKARLSQSDFIRKIINDDYTNDMSKEKIENIINILATFIKELKNINIKLHRMYYTELEQYFENKIKDLEYIISIFNN